MYKYDNLYGTIFEDNLKRSVNIWCLIGSIIIIIIIAIILLLDVSYTKICKVEVNLLKFTPHALILIAQCTALTNVPLKDDLGPLWGAQNVQY